MVYNTDKRKGDRSLQPRQLKTMLSSLQANAIVLNRFARVGVVSDPMAALIEFKRESGIKDDHFKRFAYLLSLENAID